MAQAVTVAKAPTQVRRGPLTQAMFAVGAAVGAATAAIGAMALAIEPGGCARQRGDLGGWTRDLRATPHARGS